MNPRRRKSRGPRRHIRRRRHYRRNPGFSGGIMGDLKAITPAVGWGLAGSVGVQVVPGFAGKFLPLPAKEANPMGYYGVKFLTAIGLGFLAGKMLSRQSGRYVLVGGVLTVAAEAVNHYALAPAGLATYLPDTVQDFQTYLPGDEPMGQYLGPGATVEDFQDDETGITRLDPNRRF